MQIGIVRCEAGTFTLTDTGWEGESAVLVEYLNRYYPPESSPVAPFGVLTLQNVAERFGGQYIITADAYKSWPFDPGTIY